MSFHRKFRNVVLAKDARDRQRKVGPSNLSNPCTKCLAYDMLGVPERETDFVMGAKIGTAIHAWLEGLIIEGQPDWEPEQKVTIGELGTYGTIKGTMDLYVPEDAMVVDFKTTTRPKLQKLLDEFQSDEPSGKVQAYLAQTHLYALGAENAGKDVESITIVFIPRDSVTFGDIRTRTVPYDRDYALHVWDRAKALWTWLDSENGDPAELDSDPHCFNCG